MASTLSEKDVIEALSSLSGWVDVCVVGERTLDRALTKQEAWEVGSRMASCWKDRTGLTHPPFALVQKRFGAGTHLKAVYPPSWIDEIALVVKVVASSKSVENGFQEYEWGTTSLEGPCTLENLFGLE